MKYTVSDSTLQYKVGLTLSFLSLISRGVGPFQKGNTSIYPYILSVRQYCIIITVLFSSTTVQYTRTVLSDVETWSVVPIQILSR